MAPILINTADKQVCHMNIKNVHNYNVFFAYCPIINLVFLQKIFQKLKKLEDLFSYLMMKLKIKFSKMEANLIFPIQTNKLCITEPSRVLKSKTWQQ